MDFLESCFFVNVITYDDEEEEEEEEEDEKKNGDDDKKEDDKEEEKEENGEKGILQTEAMQNMLDNYGHIYRSKVGCHFFIFPYLGLVCTMCRNPVMLDT